MAKLILRLPYEGVIIDSDDLHIVEELMARSWSRTCSYEYKDDDGKNIDFVQPTEPEELRMSVYPLGKFAVEHQFYEEVVCKKDK